MLVQRAMFALLTRFLLALRSVIEARASRGAEILVLRQQLLVLKRRSPARLRLQNIDRLMLVWLYRLFPCASSKLDPSKLRARDGAAVVTLAHEMAESELDRVGE
jgi:hypothetical protein